MPYIVGNMEFKSKGQAQRAMKELDIIDQIESSADISDPVLAEQLFVQFRANGAFKTKLGLNFLAQLQRTAGIDASEWDSAQHAEAKLSPLKAVLIVLIVVIVVCAAVVAALSYFGRDGIENQNRTSSPVGMWVFFDRKPIDRDHPKLCVNLHSGVE